MAPTYSLLALCIVATAFSAARASDPDVRPLPPVALASLSGRLTPVSSMSPPEALGPGQPTAAVRQEASLCDLEGFAMANNPTLAQAAARVQAARGTWLQVGLYPNPIIGYQGVEIGNEGSAGQQGLYLEQEFVLGGKRRLSRAAAEQAVRQAEQELEAQRLRVVNDVRTGFYETLLAQRRVVIVRQLVQMAEQGFNATGRLYEAQEIARADLLQSRIELNSARLLAVNAENAYQSSWRRLTATIGLPGLTPLALNGDLMTAAGHLTWEESLARLMTSSPELASARAGVERARWTVDRERVERVPNIDLQVTLQHDNATTDDIVGAQAVLPVPIFNRNQGSIGRAEAELTIARAEVQRIELDLQQRLAIAFEQFANASAQVRRYLDEILPDSEKTLDLVSRGFREGEIGFLALLTAQRTHIQSQLAYLDALRNLHESRVAIEGLLLSNSLNPGQPSPAAAVRSGPESSPVMSGLGSR